MQGYYSTCCSNMKDPDDKLHCSRFHDNVKYTKALQSNPVSNCDTRFGKEMGT